MDSASDTEASGMARKKVRTGGLALNLVVRCFKSYLHRFCHEENLDNEIHGSELPEILGKCLLGRENACNVASSRDEGAITAHHRRTLMLTR